jgi:PadR family transcriptional regulator PadR
MLALLQTIQNGLRHPAAYRQQITVRSCCVPNWSRGILLLVSQMTAIRERSRLKQKREAQQGTLAPMVLKTLDVLGPQISGELLSLNWGTQYPLLLRVEQEGTIASEWSPSENNRRACFYRLKRAGHKLLKAEKPDREQTAAIMARFFEVKAQDLA